MRVPKEQIDFINDDIQLNPNSGKESIEKYSRIKKKIMGYEDNSFESFINQLTEDDQPFLYNMLIVTKALVYDLIEREYFEAAANAKRVIEVMTAYFDRCCEDDSECEYDDEED